MILFSVIIPTCNRNDLLAKCLDKLTYKSQTIDASLYEVIVTDDSRDASARQLVQKKYAWAQWVDGPKKGPASNRNNGAKHANGKWLVFIDDDCLPQNDILKRYMDATALNEGYRAFEGSILPDSWDLLKKEMAECPVNLNGNAFWSANICVEKELFFSIDGFDEKFLLAAQEDEDIFKRIKEHTEVKFLKECIVIHPVRFISLRKKVIGIKKQYKNYLYFFKKHSNTSVKQHLLKSVGNYIRMSVKDVAQLRPRQFTLHALNSAYCLYLFFTYREY